MEEYWLNQTKKLHAHATTGLEFASNDYERDRYHEMQKIAADMLARLVDESVSTIDQILLEGIDGYVTPKVDVRAAVIKDEKILLVQEKTDERWALPGGYADVGISAADNAVKEVWEEAGIKVEAKKLYAVRHKARKEYKPDIRDFYKLFFMCERLDEQELAAGSEVLDAQYFSIDALPELSLGRTVKSDLEMAFKYEKNKLEATFFDESLFDYK